MRRETRRGWWFPTREPPPLFAAGHPITGTPTALKFAAGNPFTAPNPTIPNVSWGFFDGIKFGALQRKLRARASPIRALRGAIYLLTQMRYSRLAPAAICASRVNRTPHAPRYRKNLLPHRFRRQEGVLRFIYTAL